MSNRDEDTRTERLIERRRRATRNVVLGVVVTVLGLAGLVVTEPVIGSSPVQPRVWALGAVFAGLTLTVASLVARASPLAAEPSRPMRPNWLLLVPAGMGLAVLIRTATSGFEDPQELVAPGLLTVYPLALYGHMSWRFRRAARADAAR